MKLAHEPNSVYRRLLRFRRPDDDLGGADGDVVWKLDDAIRGDVRQKAHWKLGSHSQSVARVSSG